MDASDEVARSFKGRSLAGRKRIIRLLSPENWYEARHRILPARLPSDFEADLLDIEKWYSEFSSANPVVQRLIASGYKDYARGLTCEKDTDLEEKRALTAYQLATCYASSFGAPLSQTNVLTADIRSRTRLSTRASSPS